MVNFTGALVAVASTTVAATTIRTQAQTTIPTHTNWTLVESTTMNAGAVPCDVYKCASAGNGLGADFYVGLMQNAGNLYLGIAEGYNSTTHKPKRPAMRATVTLQTLQADGGVVSATAECDWFNGTINPGGGALTVSTSNSNVFALSPATTDDYQIIVAADCLILFDRASTNDILLYAGGYDTRVPTPATNDPLPLIVARASTNAVCDAMRLPLCGGLSRGWAGGCNGSVAAESGGGGGLGLHVKLSNTTLLLGTAGGVTSTDGMDLYLGAPAADKLAILNSYTNASATLGRDLNGWLRGSYRHLRSLPLAAGVTVLDTCTIDGATHFYAGAPGGVGHNLWVESNPA